MNTRTVAVLAHVDAGKTTLTEAMLFTAGAIRRQGRVDKGDAYLDTNVIERERGITVFSKQALFTYGDTDITLLDTPGHVDFACETERVLSVPDVCVLVVSAADPIRSHTKTLWQLVAAHRIPAFVFVNKTDLCPVNHPDVVKNLRAELGGAFADFTLTGDRFYEEAAGADEHIMEDYFGTGTVSDENIRHEIGKRRLFPVYFGSALRGDGIRAFLDGLCRFSSAPPYGGLFGARVFKVTRDPSGARLTFLKVTGGTLKAKDTLHFKSKSGEDVQEKAEQIRLYSAEKFRPVKEAPAGTVCAVTGLTETYAGLGIGMETSEDAFSLEPIFTFRAELPTGTDPHTVFENFLKLSEEEPMLRPTFDSRRGDILLRLMGDMQTEIIRRVYKDRFGGDVSFREGRILYKETIAAPTDGAGHFEPLRHYAEVHLHMEPLPPGSGLVFASDCPTDTLAASWQRLILTHLEERAHRGVLTGAPITDMQITLTAGRAHLKHTEGGDFRQATYRAVRQGLMKADSVLLEPFYDYTLTLPAAALGRAVTELSECSATTNVTDNDGKRATLTGRGPASVLSYYPAEVRAYTKGEGEMTLRYAGFFPCHNAQEVIAEEGYDPAADERNPADSVFCKNGCGYTVPWNEADAQMHVRPETGKTVAETVPTVRHASPTGYRGTAEEDKELERIFESTYGKIKRKSAPERKEYTAPAETRKEKSPAKKRGDEFLLVDGYNIIFAWEDTAVLARQSLEHARERLLHILSNYAGLRKCRIILVFDAYRVKDGKGSMEQYGPVTVVYTKERQTADAYIERTSYEIAKEHFVRVATSDAAEQMIVLGNGALRVSAEELREELRTALLEIEPFLKPGK